MLWQHSAKREMSASAVCLSFNETVCPTSHARHYNCTVPLNTFKRVLRISLKRILSRETTNIVHRFCDFGPSTQLWVLTYLRSMNSVVQEGHSSGHGRTYSLQCYKPVLNCLFTHVAIGLCSNFVRKKWKSGTRWVVALFVLFFEITAWFHTYMGYKYIRILKPGYSTS